MLALSAISYLLAVHESALNLAHICGLHRTCALSGAKSGLMHGKQIANCGKRQTYATLMAIGFESLRDRG